MEGDETTTQLRVLSKEQSSQLQSATNVDKIISFPGYFYSRQIISPKISIKNEELHPDLDEMDRMIVDISGNDSVIRLVRVDKEVDFLIDSGQVCLDNFPAQILINIHYDQFPRKQGLHASICFAIDDFNVRNVNGHPVTQTFKDIIKLKTLMLGVNKIVDLNNEVWSDEVFFPEERLFLREAYADFTYRRELNSVIPFPQNISQLYPNLVKDLKFKEQ
ncbi:hypothetical protein KC678_00930 [Candidatus Dojkabacteria bacterium]|uniref:Uncharacterized protein n=1 Tax=Candidatus Dojkabacteria bacterium TaxID=2099670 RepID=A0A955L112_9BACT|nr:hypothetical protein [Candidatus Dojkabacteria bacterium]